MADKPSEVSPTAGDESTTEPLLGPSSETAKPRTPGEQSDDEGPSQGPVIGESVPTVIQDQGVETKTSAEGGGGGESGDGDSVTTTKSQEAAATKSEEVTSIQSEEETTAAKSEVAVVTKSEVEATAATNLEEAAAATTELHRSMMIAAAKSQPVDLTQVALILNQTQRKTESRRW